MPTLPWNAPQLSIYATEHTASIEWQSLLHSKNVHYGEAKRTIKHAEISILKRVKVADKPAPNYDRLSSIDLITVADSIILNASLARHRNSVNILIACA